MTLAARLRTARVIAGPPLRWLHSALHGRLRQKRLQRPPAGQPLTIPTPDGLTLSALFYPSLGPQASLPAPAFLILHGWDPLGQRHGYYLALAAALTRRGYHVMTLNLRGYPGSGVPEDPAGFNLTALTNDVRAALQTLRTLPGVDPQRLVLFGHSYGAGLVLPTLAAEPELWRAVVHGPSIWVEERITGDESGSLGPQHAFFHERYWRYMRLREPIPLEVYLRVKQDLYLLEQLDCLAPGHAPLLLLDGGAEGPDTWRFLRLLYERLPRPVSYYTIPGADHFCNTAAIGPLLVVDVPVIESLCEYLDVWLNHEEHKGHEA